VLLSYGPIGSASGLSKYGFVHGDRRLRGANPSAEDAAVVRVSPGRFAALGALRVISDGHVRKTATEYDRTSGVKWLSGTEK
jgi:hypothetical protein